MGKCWMHYLIHFFYSSRDSNSAIFGSSFCVTICAHEECIQHFFLGKLTCSKCSISRWIMNWVFSTMKGIDRLVVEMNRIILICVASLNSFSFMSHRQGWRKHCITINCTASHGKTFDLFLGKAHNCFVVLWESKIAATFQMDWAVIQNQKR